MFPFFHSDDATNFAYELGAEVEGVNQNSIWRLHSGKEKVSGKPVSIFVFENSSQETQDLLGIAKSALKQMKKLKHPSFLTYVDSLETDNLVYLVVDPVKPLELHLAKNSYTHDKKKLAIAWGLYQITLGLEFLNNSCHLCHRNICLGSVFVNQSGEWKIFDLEHVTPVKELFKVIPSLQTYNPPELEGARDFHSFGLACLIWEIFNGRLSNGASLKVTSEIPICLHHFYSELFGPSQNVYQSFSILLKKSFEGKDIFINKFIDSMLFLNEIYLKGMEENLNFFDNLAPLLHSFPEDICLHKILPELLYASKFEIIASSVLAPLCELGKVLPDHEYKKTILPYIMKMFSSDNRDTRTKLLQQVEQFINCIHPAVIRQEIYPRIAQGFSDTNPVIRDLTIKCMLYLAPKLPYEILDIDMMRHFWRCLFRDEQVGIRRNIIVCLCKISPYLRQSNRESNLIKAYHHGLQDPSPSVRLASIMALSASSHYYSINNWQELIFCPLRETIFTAMDQWKCSRSVVEWNFSAEKNVKEYAITAFIDLNSKYKKLKEDPRLLAERDKELENIKKSPIAVTWTPWNIPLSESIEKELESTTPSQIPVTWTPLDNALAESIAHTKKATRLEDSNIDMEHCYYHCGNEVSEEPVSIFVFENSSQETQDLISEKWIRFFFGSVPFSQFQKKSDVKEESPFFPDNSHLDTRKSK